MLSATPASSAVIFYDGFDSGADPAWGDEYGTWTASGGVYDGVSGIVYGCNAPSPCAAYSSVTTYPSLTDFTVELDVNDIADGGVWLKSSGPNTGVLLVTGGYWTGSNAIYWHIMGASSISDTAIFNYAYIPGLAGSDASLEIVVSGDVYEAYLNGTLVTSLTTSAFDSGAVALYDWSGQTFDNVTISTPDATVPEPSTLLLIGSGMTGLALVRRRMGRKG